MKKKLGIILFISSFSAAIMLIPIFGSSCSDSTENNNQNNAVLPKKPTLVNDLIQANSLGLFDTAVQSINLIDSSFIFERLNLFINGSHELKSISEITIISKKLSSNSIYFTFSLDVNTWYDQNGQLGSNLKTFTTSIIGFKSENQKLETVVVNPISASSISLNTKTAQQAQSLITTELIFNNLNIFFSGDNNIGSTESI